MNKALCIVWLLFIAALSIKQIGTPRVPSTGLWTADEAMMLFSYIFIPAFLGYMAGKE